MAAERNPPWTRDELLVALDYYLDNSDDYFSPAGEGVLDLTAKISQVAKALGLTGSDTLRNANGVSMKLLNFRAHDPNHDTKGLSRGNKLEEVVWAEYAGEPEAKAREERDAVARRVRTAAETENRRRLRNAGLFTDLVLLCANCHRMVHASRPWWTVEQLRAALPATV